MTDDVALLSHHSKKTYKASSYVSDTGQQQQRLYVVLARLTAAGFSVDTDGQRLKVSPSKLLTVAQRDWIQQHKPALVAAVSAPCWRWCIEYPAGPRYVVDCVPDADWRNVAADYSGAAVWPAPEGLDVSRWIATRETRP